MVFGGVFCAEVEFERATGCESFKQVVFVCSEAATVGAFDVDGDGCDAEDVGGFELLADFVGAQLGGLVGSCIDFDANDGIVQIVFFDGEGDASLGVGAVAYIDGDGDEGACCEFVEVPAGLPSFEFDEDTSFLFVFFSEVNSFDAAGVDGWGVFAE